MKNLNFILATQKSGSNSPIKITKSINGDAKTVIDRMIAFLDVELGVSGISCDIVGSPSNRCKVYSAEIKNSEKRLVLFSTTPDDHETREKYSVVDFASYELCRLISSLISSGHLSLDFEINDKKAKILFVDLEDSSSYSSGYKANIKRYAGNDALLFGMVQHNKGDAGHFNKYFDYTGQIKLFKSVIAADGICEVANYAIQEGNNNYLFTSHDCDGEPGFIQDAMNSVNINNSLLLSKEFIASFNEMSDREFNFTVMKGTTISGSKNDLVQISSHKISENIDNEGFSVVDLAKDPILSVDGDTDLVLFMSELITREDAHFKGKLIDYLISYLFSSHVFNDHFWDDSNLKIDCVKGVNVIKFMQNNRVRNIIHSRLDLGEIKLVATLADQAIEIVVCKNNITYAVVEVESGIVKSVFVGNGEGLALDCLVNKLIEHVPEYVDNKDLMANDINSLLASYGMTGFGCMTSDYLLDLL